MVKSTYKGKIYALSESYPIYNGEDDSKIIGYTEAGDQVIIVYEDPSEDYYETIIVSGTHTGVDTLALSSEDIKKSTLCNDYSRISEFKNVSIIKVILDHSSDDEKDMILNNLTEDQTRTLLQLYVHAKR